MEFSSDSRKDLPALGGPGEAKLGVVGSNHNCTYSVLLLESSEFIGINSSVNQKAGIFLDLYSFFFSEVSLQHAVFIKENSGNCVTLKESICASN